MNNIDIDYVVVYYKMGLEDGRKSCLEGLNNRSERVISFTVYNLEVYRYRYVNSTISIEFGRNEINVNLRALGEKFELSDWDKYIANPEELIRKYVFNSNNKIKFICIDYLSFILESGSWYSLGDTLEGDLATVNIDKPLIKGDENEIFNTIPGGAIDYNVDTRKKLHNYLLKMGMIGKSEVKYLGGNLYDAERPRRFIEAGNKLEYRTTVASRIIRKLNLSDVKVLDTCYVSNVNLDTHKLEVISGGTYNKCNIKSDYISSLYISELVNSKIDIVRCGRVIFADIDCSEIKIGHCNELDIDIEVEESLIDIYYASKINLNGNDIKNSTIRIHSPECFETVYQLLEKANAFQLDGELKIEVSEELWNRQDELGEYLHGNISVFKEK